MAARAIATPIRPATRRMCRQRSITDLRAKRYDPPPSRNTGRTPRPGTRSRTVRVDTATYRRRRRFVGLAVAVAVTVLSLGAQAGLTGPGSGPASAAGTGAALGTRAVRAQAGDSLWSIAQEHRGDINIDRYIDKLVELNGGTSIMAGQLVRLP